MGHSFQRSGRSNRPLVVWECARPPRAAAIEILSDSKSPFQPARAPVILERGTPPCGSRSSCSTARPSVTCRPAACASPRAPRPRSAAARETRPAIRTSEGAFRTSLDSATRRTTPTARRAASPARTRVALRSTADRSSLQLPELSFVTKKGAAWLPPFPQRGAEPPAHKHRAIRPASQPSESVSPSFGGSSPPPGCQRSPGPDYRNRNVPARSK